MKSDEALKKNTKPRKKPSQHRSKEKVQHILDATIRLLETTGVEGITTNHIAKEAGISVASLYQYYPNKHAVIYAIYQKWLASVVDKFDYAEQNYYMKFPWAEFFDKLITDIFETSIFSTKAEIQLSHAMGASKELTALDDKHSKEIASRIATYLKGYGATWSKQKLELAGLMLYDLSDLTFKRTDQLSDEKNWKQMLNWGKTMGFALISECLE